METSISSQVAALELRIKRIEGTFGVEMRQIKGELDAAIEENEQLRAEIDEANDTQAKRTRIQQLAPQVLANSKFSPDQQTFSTNVLVSDCEVPGFGFSNDFAKSAAPPRPKTARMKDLRFICSTPCKPNNHHNRSNNPKHG